MANIHTLVSGPGVSNIHPCCTELNTKFYGYTAAGALARPLNSGRKRERGNCDNFRSYPFRVSVIGESRRSSDTTELSLVREGSNKNINGQNQTRMIEIPVTCYQIIGLHDQAEKDEIVKSVMHLKNAEIEEGYTKDTVLARQALLIDVRDKLLFEPLYAGNIKDKQPPKSSICITWNWLPGALCLLQEVGEAKLVLEIGRRALQNSESKPFVHDLLLSMALSECTIAKFGFEKNNISQGFEALARAQCLLRSKISLGKMMLLSQIEESLEELAPACTLDLLGMPQTPENAERRIGAIAALRELLRQGLDVESSCRVQDWACFLGQALKKLMATEIVELVNWDSLALIRKNRKSLESQNQRIVVDSNSFYVVMLAHIALGFTSRQPDLISKAKTLCECLTAAEGIDLKFEDSYCSFLLGQGDEATAVESLRQLQRSSSLASQDTVQMNESKDASSANKLLESWLNESVLALFNDTRDCSSSLAEFFSGDKRGSRNKQGRKSSHTVSVSSPRHRPIAVTLSKDQRDGEPPSGSAVKQLAPPDLRNPLMESEAISGASPSVQLKRSLGSKHETWKFWLSFSHKLGKMMFATAVGCILFAVFRSVKLRGWRARNEVGSRVYEQRLGTFSSTSNQNFLVETLKKAMSALKIQSESCDSRTASLSSGLPTFLASTTHRGPMPVEDAETLVKQWQAIKAKALGPDHDVLGLEEILEGSMLVQWEELANAAKSRSCFWRFVLLRLSILHAETLRDSTGTEMAEIEVLLEEAAELVDQNQPKNPTYYSPYRIRYLLKKQEDDDGSWRFSEGEILKPS